MQCLAERLPKASPVDILEARMVIEPGFADLVVARATETTCSGWRPSS
jgi:DNA-binding FadR family transcriptional regulator